MIPIPMIPVKNKINMISIPILGAAGFQNQQNRYKISKIGIIVSFCFCHLWNFAYLCGQNEIKH